MIPASPPLLAVEALRVEAAGGIPLVRDIGFTLRAGETLGIVGESGSGKSLTCRAILGVLPSGLAVTGGHIRFDGVDMTTLDRRGWAALRGRRLSAVFQDPGSYLNPSIAVGRQMAEALRVTSALSRSDARGQALDLLHRVGIRNPEIVYHQYPFELSGGMLQRVLIAIAVSANPDLLIADEPTTALDVTVQAEILDLLAGLQRDRQLALLIVSHDLAVISQVADRVLIMRHGEIVEAGTTAKVLHKADHAYTRSLLDHHARYGVARFAAPARPWDILPPAPPAAPPAADALLRVDGVDVAYGRGAVRRQVLRSVSLEVGRGESVGLIGETGSGKTTLLRTILGLARPDAGTIHLDGLRTDTLDRRGLRAFRRRGALQYVFQDPLQSLDPDLPVAGAIAEGLRLRGDLGAADIATRVARILDEVELDRGIAARRPAELSGGQRQRAVLARALALDPALLLLDEPVSALDAASRAQILDLLRRIGRERGIAQIFVSHDLGSVAGITDRIAVLYRGRIVEAGPTLGLLRQPRHPYTRRLMASAPSLVHETPAMPVPSFPDRQPAISDAYLRVGSLP